MKYPVSIRARMKTSKRPMQPMQPRKRPVGKVEIVSAQGATIVVPFPTVLGLKLEIGALRVGAVSGEAGNFVQFY